MSGRDTASIRRYHDATKHSFASIRQSPHTLDWDNMPLPFKVYTALEPIALPRDFATSTRPVLAALADPGAAAGPGPPLGRTTLAHLLYFTAGVLRRKPYPGGEIYFRAAATRLATRLAVAAACDLPARVVLGFVDDAVNRLLGVDGEREVALSLDALGRGQPPTSPPAMGALAVDTLPLSKREIDYPVIREAHLASSLGSPEEV